MSAEAAYVPVTDTLIEELRDVIGDRVSTSASVRDHHGNGEDYFTPVPPDAVCFAHSTEEVSALVKVCARHGTPIIAYGTGTSLEGHVVALHGGICIDLSEMNDVLEGNEADLDCRVQAGVTRKQLNEYLRATGLFFPIDPGADASLGGMAATRASGTNELSKLITKLKRLKKLWSELRRTSQRLRQGTWNRWLWRSTPILPPAFRCAGGSSIPAKTWSSSSISSSTLTCRLLRR